MKEKLVYLFDKDGSYKIINVDRSMNRIGYYNHDPIDNPCWQPDGDYIQYREPVKDWLEVKTLTKIVSIDSYNLKQGLAEGASLIKDNLNYGQCTGSYEKAMGFGREFRLELNYAVVKDSPLHTIITELEKTSRSSSDKDTEHQKDINVLVDKIRKRDKVNTKLANDFEESKQHQLLTEQKLMSSLLETSVIKTLIEEPTIYFIFSLLMNWFKNLLKISK